MQIEHARPHKEAVIALLAAEKLPTADLPEILNDFIVAIIDGAIVGVAGLETYGNYGLLRSLTVKAEHRNAGIADALLHRIEAISHSKGIHELYLLTETALEYFKGKGFKQITREHIPVEVQASSEFSHVCPVSAIAMKKKIT